MRDSSGAWNTQVGVIAGDGGQNLSSVEPGHVGHLLGVDDNILVQGNPVTADHQRRWKGPGLGRVIAYLSNTDACFLFHFSAYRFFQGFALIDKSC